MIEFELQFVFKVILIKIEIVINLYIPKNNGGGEEKNSLIQETTNEKTTGS